MLQKTLILSVYSRPLDFLMTSENASFEREKKVTPSYTYSETDVSIE